MGLIRQRRAHCVQVLVLAPLCVQVLVLATVRGLFVRPTAQPCRCVQVLVLAPVCNAPIRNCVQVLGVGGWLREVGG